jgi:hypothetical protein
MTAAWMRDGTGKIWQVAGNFAAYSNTENEDEGTTNETIYRTSGFKDWFALAGTAGSSEGVNGIYDVSAADGKTGWVFSRGGVTKEITMGSASVGEINAAYTLSAVDKLFVRFGLSPNLLDLMLRGHEGLTTEVPEGNTRVSLANASGSEVVRAYVEAPFVNASAKDTDVDAPTTVQRRNQAQTHLVEVELSGSGTHLVTLGFDDGGGNDPDSDADGLPDGWEWQNFGNLNRDGSGDADGDGLTDREEYIVGSDPNNASSGYPRLHVQKDGTGFRVAFPTVSGRRYTVSYRDNLASGSWTPVELVGPGEQNPADGTGGTVTVTDTSAAQSAGGSRFYQVGVELAP